MFRSWAEAGTWEVGTRITIEHLQAIYEAIIARTSIPYTMISKLLTSSVVYSDRIKSASQLQCLVDMMRKLTEEESMFNQITYLETPYSNFPAENGAEFDVWACSKEEQNKHKFDVPTDHAVISTEDWKILLAFYDVLNLYKYKICDWIEDDPLLDEMPPLKYHIIGKHIWGKAEEDVYTQFQRQYTETEYIDNLIRTKYSDWDEGYLLWGEPMYVRENALNLFYNKAVAQYDEAKVEQAKGESDYVELCKDGKLCILQSAGYERTYDGKIYCGHREWYPTEIRLYPPFVKENERRAFDTVNIKVYGTKKKEVDLFVDKNNDYNTTTKTITQRSIILEEAGVNPSVVWHGDLTAWVDGHLYSGDPINQVSAPATWGEWDDDYAGQMQFNREHYWEYSIAVVIEPNYYLIESE